MGLAGMAGIVILSLVALSKGIDGIALAAAFAGLVGIATGTAVHLYDRRSRRRGR